jgi:molybdopterin converting factor small subunit
MLITVKLFAGLTKLIPEEGGKTTLEMAENITVGEVLDHLKVPVEAPHIYFINGIHANREKTLKEADTLSVFPPVAGG